MPRQARKISNLSIHHVILRSVNQQIIFEDEMDYKQFLKILRYYKKHCNFKLYAYCLMDNHIHLLIEHTTVALDVIMKKIGIKFVVWYNRKYQRAGHLFQDRYRSEPVNDMRYFQIVFRYIHQNPLKAGLENSLGIYPWSSYRDYAFSDSSFIDIEKILGLFRDHQECMEYLCARSDDKCMEYNTTSRFPDSEALKIIREKTICDSPSDFQHMERAKRNQNLKILYQSGISIRQLSRLTGISRTSISNAVK